MVYRGLQGVYRVYRGSTGGLQGSSGSTVSRVSRAPTLHDAPGVEPPSDPLTSGLHHRVAADHSERRTLLRNGNREVRSTTVHPTSCRGQSGGGVASLRDLTLSLSLRTSWGVRQSAFAMRGTTLTFSCSAFMKPMSTGRSLKDARRYRAARTPALCTSVYCVYCVY
ncbi:hypothetical protein EYF80_040566 [Liparis tanakae]|uniref:Uncharacterized protein n=1 Tax=Liparis tanakae TaxID=230148 RepID=A0A4Z2G6S8_9TELE|nr:hypothetical protein EYF80_040566 [Liparis tanakae]